ncbi:MAG: hypothetical protein AAF415_12880 [Pseudomonadota bacterium]
MSGVEDLYAIDPIGAIEDAMIARLKDAFGFNETRRALRKVDRIEVPFDASSSKIFEPVPPACYVLPLLVRPGDYPGNFDVRWAVYAVSGKATSTTRARGGSDPMGLGAYAIAMRAAAVLENWNPELDCAGTIQLVGIENLSGLTLVDRRLSVWALTMTGSIDFELQNPDADLAPFLTFHADFDVPPYDAPPAELPAARDANLKVELPQ